MGCNGNLMLRRSVEEMERGAVLDPTGVYRYSLWRNWNPDAPKITFVMLNPSQADAHQDDPTLRRCIGFAQDWGYGSLEVVNLFAFRATRPQALRTASDPIGPACDRYLLAAASVEQIVVAWGNWGRLHLRDRAVLKLLAPHAPISCLGLNQAGQPRHPLYVPKSVTPICFCKGM